VLWIRKILFGFGYEFGTTNYFIRILILIFWPKIFQKSASHCNHKCSGTCTTEEKKSFTIKNSVFFCFQVFEVRFFWKFLFNRSVWIRIRTFIQIRIRPKLWILSYSDPQHCLQVVNSNKPVVGCFIKLIPINIDSCLGVLTSDHNHGCRIYRYYRSGISIYSYLPAHGEILRLQRHWQIAEIII
jgi:hypothetical protein